MNGRQFFPRTLAEAFDDERFPAMFGPYRRSRRWILRSVGGAMLLLLLLLGALGV